MNESQLKQANDQLKKRQAQISALTPPRIGSTVKSFLRTEVNKPAQIRTCYDCDQPAAGNGYCPHCATRKSRKLIRSNRIEKQRRLTALMMRAIPSLYHPARLSHLPAKLTRIIQDGHNVLMWGAVGCGKTYAAFAAIRQNLTRPCHYVNWENFLIHLRDFENKSEDSKMETLLKPDVLVIDDIGTSVSDYSTRMLFVVIDTRLNHGRRTIITTNYTPAELQTLYGERIGSRLATYRIVHLQGKDQRRKG